MLPFLLARLDYYYLALKTLPNQQQKIAFPIIVSMRMITPAAHIAVLCVLAGAAAVRAALTPDLIPDEDEGSDDDDHAAQPTTGAYSSSAPICNRLHHSLLGCSPQKLGGRGPTYVTSFNGSGDRNTQLCCEGTTNADSL